MRPRPNAAPKGSLMPPLQRPGIASMGISAHFKKCCFYPLTISGRYPAKRTLGPAI